MGVTPLWYGRHGGSTIMESWGRMWLVMSAPPPSAPRCNLIICTIEILNKLAMLEDSIVKFETITDLLTDTIHIWGENPIFRQISNVWKPNSDFCERKIRFSIKIGLKIIFLISLWFFYFSVKFWDFLVKFWDFLVIFLFLKGAENEVKQARRARWPPTRSRRAPRLLVFHTMELITFILSTKTKK